MRFRSTQFSSDKSYFELYFQCFLVRWIRISFEECSVIDLFESDKFYFCPNDFIRYCMVSLEYHLLQKVRKAS